MNEPAAKTAVRPERRPAGPKSKGGPSTPLRYAQGERIALSAMAKLGDVLCRIETGKSFLTAEVLARPDQLAVLKVSAVSWDTFRPEQAKVVVGYEPEERHRIRAGDFLISRANTRELVGAVVRVEQDHPLRLLSDKTLRLVINEARASPDYLLFALRSSAARTHIEAHATGTSDSMRNISRDVIAATPIWLPDLDVQRRIAARLKAQLAAVEQARKAAQAQLADLEALPARLLAMAFDGSGDTIGGDGKSTDSVRGEPVEP